MLTPRSDRQPVPRKPRAPAGTLPHTQTVSILLITPRVAVPVIPEPLDSGDSQAVLLAALCSLVHVQFLPRLPCGQLLCSWRCVALHMCMPHCTMLSGHLGHFRCGTMRRDAALDAWGVRALGGHNFCCGRIRRKRKS